MRVIDPWLDAEEPAPNPRPRRPRPAPPPAADASASEAPASGTSAGDTPTDGIPTNTPASHIPTGGIPADAAPASHVPTDHVPASDVPTDGIPTKGAQAGGKARGYGELTVDEMVDGHEDAAPLGERLDAVRRTESDSGVTVTVDLYGGLVDLVLGPPATRLRAPELAATVQRLATLAATAAQTEATALLTTRHPNHPLLTTP